MKYFYKRRATRFIMLILLEYRKENEIDICAFKNEYGKRVFEKKHIFRKNIAKNDSGKD